MTEAMEDIGWDRTRGTLVDLADDVIDVCSTMHPWERMLTEEFGEHGLSGRACTR